MFANFLIQASQPAGQQQGGLPTAFLFQMIAIFAILYFLMILPMQRQRKKQQQMIRELQAGATVLTSGGIIGQIVAIEDDTITVRVKPDGVKLQLARSAVSSLVNVGEVVAKK